MKRICLALLCSVAVLAFSSNVQALPPFKKAFSEKYVKTSDNADFQAAAKKASCNACHVKGEKKNVQNNYGTALNKLIEGDAKDRIAAAGKNGADAKKAETAKIMKELEAAFKKVEAMKSASGKTYGEILKSGNLPD